MDVKDTDESINMSNKKQWYAMKKRLQKEGKWSGKAPAHKVPAQEEGEPAEKIQKTAENQEAAASEGATPDPEEGTSRKAVGEYSLNIIFQITNGRLWIFSWIHSAFMGGCRVLETFKPGGSATL